MAAVPDALAAGLAARLDALERRVGELEHVMAVVGVPRRIGCVAFLPAARRVVGVGGADVSLTGCEVALLEMLVDASGLPVARGAIAERALHHRLEAGQRGADQLASSLRRKLAAVSGGQVLVLSERALGYRLAVIEAGALGG